MVKLNMTTYLAAFKSYGINIAGGTIHDFLHDSTVKYYGGMCPVYQIEYNYNSVRVVIGGNYASNNRPALIPCEPIDF